MRLVINFPKEDYNNIEPFLNGEAIKGGFNLFKVLEIIKNGTPLPKSQWIPVMERMPEDGQNVLFCDIEDDIMLGYHIKGRPDTHFSQDGTFDDIKNVKAWMPLPEAYEEKEETE